MNLRYLDELEVILYVPEREVDAFLLKNNRDYDVTHVIYNPILLNTVLKKDIKNILFSEIITQNVTDEREYNLEDRTLYFVGMKPNQGWEKLYIYIDSLGWHLDDDTGRLGGEEAEYEM